MFCTKCGNKVPDGSKFCNVCGNTMQNSSANQDFAPQQASQPVIQQPAFGQPAPTQPTYAQPTPAQPTYNQPTYSQPAPAQPAYGNPYGGTTVKTNPNTKKLVIIAAVIIALIAGVWFLVSDKTDPHESPEAVFNAYIDAYNSRDAKALCNLSADLKRNGNDPEMRAEYMEEFGEEFMSLRSISAKIKHVEYEDDMAYVICDVTFIEDGERRTNEEARFPCVKIDGKWYWED